MRQTDKYYWAKHFQTSQPEVILYHNSCLIYRMDGGGSYTHLNFYWISDEPIPQPKIPLVLKDNHYYVIQPWGLCKMLGLHNEGRFKAVSGFWSGSSVSVIAGPFTIEELVEFKPIT